MQRIFFTPMPCKYLFSKFNNAFGTGKDDFMMSEIWKNGNTLVNHLLRILAFNDSCSLQMRKGETVDKFG